MSIAALRRVARLIFPFACLASLTAPAAAAAEVGSASAGPRVVVSIAPLHSLAAKVMAGIGGPHLLVPRGASPHDYGLKPSAARMVARADLVVWVGPELENFLSKPLAALTQSKRILTLFGLPGVKRLALRRDGNWSREHHHHHDHHGDEAHGGGIDPHVWLDPTNAAVMVEAIADVLAAADPGRAQRYQANAVRAVRDLTALDASLANRLAPVKERRFFVLHDAYQYFEARYGLAAQGAILGAHGQRPSIKRIREIRARLKASGAVCVFAQPQLPGAIVANIVTGTQARPGSLDPLGLELPLGRDFYDRLLTRLAAGFAACLGARR